MKLRARLAWTVLLTALPAVAAMAWLRARYEWITTEQGLVDYAIERMESGGREMCTANPSTFAIGVGPREPGPGQGSHGPPPDSGHREDGREPPPDFRKRGPPPDFGGPPPGEHEDHVHKPRDMFDPRSKPAPRSELWAYATDFKSDNPSAPAFPDELRRQLRSGAKYASDEWSETTWSGMQTAVRMDWDDGPCAIVLARKPAREKSQAVRDLVLASLLLCAVLLGAVLLAAGPIVERVRKLTAQVRQSAADRYTTSAEVKGSDEITELAKTFNAAATEVRTNLSELESRERVLRAFLENTTHDVMLPLTVLQGHLTALRRKSDAGEPVEHGVIVDALQEAHYMASLIQNLATAARLEGGAPEIERHPLDLIALVERVVVRHRPIARARQIQLEHAVPPTPVWTDGDVTLVEQAVSNVIHNAVRYVEPGGHVAVVLEMRAHEFALRVLDDGPGIPEPLRARVFERAFRTGDARTRHPSGLGLGLSIARDVAVRHGFTLTLHCPTGGGAELELRGPLRPTA